MGEVYLRLLIALARLLERDPVLALLHGAEERVVKLIELGDLVRREGEISLAELARREPDGESERRSSVGVGDAGDLIVEPDALLGGKAAFEPAA